MKKLRHFAFFALFFAFSLPSFAQQNLVDSLLVVLPTLKKDDTTKVQTLNLLAGKYFVVDKKQTMHYAKEAAALAQKIKYPVGEFEAYRKIGDVYRHTSSIDSALMYFNKMHEVATSTKNKVLQKQSFLNVGVAQLFQGSLDKALTNFVSSLRLADEQQDKNTAARCYVNIGNINRMQSRFDKAIESYDKAIEYATELKNDDLLNRAFNNKAASYLQSKDYKKAEETLNFALIQSRKLKDLGSESNNLANFGYLSSELGQHEKALVYYQQAIAIKEQLKDNVSITKITNNMGDEYVALKDFAKAEAFFAKGLQMAKDIGSKDDIRLSYGSLANLFEKKGNFKKAYESQKLFSQWNDSIYNENSTQQINELQEKYDTDKKQKEIELLNAANKVKDLEAEESRIQRNMTFGGIALISLLFVVTMVGFWQTRKANKLIASQNQKLTVQTVELQQQKEEIETQRDNISQANLQLEKSYRNIQTISEIGQKVAATLESTTIIRTVYENVNTLMDAAAFGIGIYYPKTQSLVYEGFVEKGVMLPTHIENLATHKNSLAFQCLLQNKALFINDLSTEWQQYLTSAPTANEGELPLSLIYLPLQIEDRTTGVITVQSFKRQAYTDYHLTLLQTLASYISVALDNAGAYTEIEHKNKHITDSIRYAQTIQQAILPPKEDLQRCFADAFVFYKPKDVVSGDFYWLGEDDTNQQIYVAVIDCTGHGVPGAFMSLIANTLLNKILFENGGIKTANFLDMLHHEIRTALHQDTTANNDGMDICLLQLPKTTQTTTYQATFAGAKRPLYHLKKDGELVVWQGSKKSIGGRKIDRKFEQCTLEVTKGDRFYLTSDGFTDQCNDKRENFGTLRFKELLLTLHTLPFEQHFIQINDTLQAYQQEEAQRDDITLLGVMV